jgi:hypothetical protein
MLVGEQEFKNIEELPEGKYHCVYLDDKGKLFKQR